MENNKLNNIKFLKDVFLCSLSAFGGPEAHYGIFMEQLVVKKKYLDEKDLIEFMALTTILPGPSSTQTIISIGYKLGGIFLAFLTMLIWILPSLILMTLLSFVVLLVEKESADKILRYIGPMSVAFVIMASYRITKKAIIDKLTLLIFILSLICTLIFRKTIVFPILLIIGGIIYTYFSKEKNIFKKIYLKPKWSYLIVFFIIAIGSYFLSRIWNNRVVDLFESFYRYGYMVIGGGQVVVPFMYNELVEVKKYITSQEFLSGFGFVQGLPGTMFSFSSYAGALSCSNYGAVVQFISGILSGIAIFLPGVLLIFFVYPIWEELKSVKAIKISLKGIISVSAALISSTSIILIIKNINSIGSFVVLIISTLLIYYKKIPPYLLILAIIILGYIL